MLKLWVRFENACRRFCRNEQGIQTIEWVGLGLLALGLLAAATSMIGKDTTIGETIVEKIKGWIEGLGS